MHNELLKKNRVLPVITIDDVQAAVPLAKALHKGGLSVIEITLRTPVALAAIKDITNQVPEVTVGAGTIIHAQQFDQAMEAGAQFFVSPGMTEKLIKKAQANNVFYIPGVSTISEAMRAVELGLTTLKFFPAELSGGITTLKIFHTVLPEIQFCPTGGIKQTIAKDYLQLDNVLCVGGSWLSPAKLITEQRWDEITQLAKQSLQAVK